MRSGFGRGEGGLPHSLMGVPFSSFKIRGEGKGEGGWDGKGKGKVKGKGEQILMS